MKTSPRIHRNGGKKADPSQVQTRRAGIGADNVRMVIREPNGRFYANFEIPKAFCAAMLRDAKTKGISFVDWINSAVSEKSCREKEVAA